MLLQGSDRKKSKLIVSLLIVAWVFSGWPRVGNFPPEISDVHAGTATLTTSQTWEAPAGVNQVTVKVRGGGGAGSPGSSTARRAGGGGGGGAYTECTVTVTPLTNYNVVVAALVTAGNGNSSNFTGENGTCTANGGMAGSNHLGGTGGAAETVGGIVTASYAGGNGGSVADINNIGGGGGGEGAGNSSDGDDGSPNSGTTGGAGGTGGNGGDGGKGGNNNSSNSGHGVAAGGGGGGAGSRNNVVGRGARGEIVLEWVVNASPTLSVAQPDGTDDMVASGNPYSITYSLADANDAVTAAFYYDTDNTGYDGTAITGACAAAAEGTNAICAWDTTGVSTGSYYVYGVANDGFNAPVKVYSPGTITIIPPPEVSIVLTTDGSVDFGLLPENGTEDSTASGLNDLQTILVESGPADLGIKTSTFSAGENSWVLGSDAGDNTVKWEFSDDGSAWTLFEAADNLYAFEAGVAQDSTKDVYFRITTPTATNSYQQYSASVTIIASEP